MITLISSFEPLILIIIAVNVIISFFINTKTINIQHKYYEDKVPYQRESEYVKRVFYLKEYAKELRLFNGFSTKIINIFNDAVDKLIIIIQIYSKKLSKYFRAQTALSALFNAVIMLYLAYKVVNKNLDVGDFIALSSGSQQLAGQLSKLLNIFPQLYEHSIYIENFVEFMNYKSNICREDNSAEVTKVSNIDLKDVSFAYPMQRKTTLKNINF